MNADLLRTEYHTTAQELHAAVITRAWKDDAFRQLLVDNPKAAIKEASGVDLPANFDVRVLEMTDGYLPVVIPEPTPAQQAASVDDIVGALSGHGAGQPHARFLARVWKEDTLREELARAPRQVLERELGTKLPDGIDVAPFFDSATLGHLVLPPNPNVDSEELTDDQLDAVSGGITPTVVIATVGLGLVFTVGVATLIGQPDFENSGGSGGGLQGLGW